MDNGASSYRRFLDGDENGIVEIIRDYKDGLILYLNGFTHNIHVSEELTEEAFIKLVVKKPRFSEKSSFKTWLYAIARNTAIDYLRHKSGAYEIPIEESQRAVSDEEDLEKAYLRGERKIALHKALKKLNPEYSRVLYLIYFEGFDNAQAAKIMKKSKRQIENLVYRAKKSLKSELEREGFNYEEL